MNYNNFLTSITKNKKLLFFGFGFVVILYICSQFGLVIIQTEDNSNKKVFINKILSNSKQTKGYDIKKSKTMIVKKGNYSFDMYKDNQTSTVYSKIKGFWVKKLFIKNFNQKSSEYVGESGFDCMNAKGENVLLYSCKNNIDTNSVGIELVNSESGIKKSVFNYDYLDSYTNLDVDQNGGITIKNISDGLIIFLKNKAGKLLSIKVNFSGQLENPKTFENVDVKTVISDKNIDTNTEGSSFSALFGNELFYSENNQIKKINVNSSVTNYRIVYLDSSIYLFDDQQAIDNIGAEHMGKNNVNKSEKTEVVRIDKKSNKVKNIKLDENFMINYFSKNDKSLLLFAANTTKRPIMLDDNGKKSELLIDTNNIISPCLSSDFFYFVSSDRMFIYQYSFKDSLSKVLYQTQKFSINSISCMNDVVGINSLDNNTSDSLNKLFRLSDEQIGYETRITEFLPMTYTYKSDTYDLSLMGKKIVVKLSYDSDGNGRSSDKDLTDEFNKIFSEKGLNTTNLQYIFQ